VAERGSSPNIFIYEWPTFRLYRVMRKGTELNYAHCEFSPSGTKLVSLGNFPDYNLTVWDWVNERVVLKCKAFGQEVFRCSFSPFSDDIIFTGGSGHIKFWKMAQTFTGLKLQGEIAKYGQLELSDVAGYHELPDGKIVSGTEYGTLILWEGNLVKAHLVLNREEKTPLHNGGIETVLFENDHFITSGVDGMIKWWPLHDIDTAEADEIAEFAIVSTKEVCIKHEDGRPAHLVSMVRGKEFWLLNDAAGAMWRLNCQDFTYSKVLEYHSGRITDMALSDAYNLAVSVAENGEVKVWDYCRQKAIFSKLFDGSALSVDILRRSELNKGRVIAVGYDTGIVRILQITDMSIDVAIAFKAAESAVKFVRYAPS
jgi:cilia- and flagella-associated protein 44